MEALLDETVFGELYEALAAGPDGAAEVAAYVEIFLDSTGAAVGDLAPALAAGDAAALRRLLHQVRGTTATMGASRVAHRCAEVEAALADRVPPAHLAGPLAALRDDFAATAAALHARLGGLVRTGAANPPGKEVSRL